MPFNLEVGHKFGLLVAKVVEGMEGLSSPVRADAQSWFLPGLPIRLPDYWLNWLGNLQAEEINTSTFCLVVTEVDEQPEVNNELNKLLRKRVEDWFYCILYQGLPYLRDIYTFTGANVAGTVTVQDSGKHVPVFKLDRGMSATITPATIKMGFEMAPQYRRVFESQGLFRRIGLGFHSLARGLREEYVDFRIHDFVRAVEGLVRLVRGEGEQIFVERCQQFTRPCEEAKQSLSQMWRLRCANEHLERWLRPLGGESPAALRIAEERLWQAEKLALGIYTRILSSPTLLDEFHTDDAIDAFWGLDSDSRTSKWGERMDITRYGWTTVHGVLEVLGEKETPSPPGE